VNREDVDFSNAADMKAVQEFFLADDIKGEIDYIVKYVSSS
jgi:hypothetical protein